MARLNRRLRPTLLVRNHRTFQLPIDVGQALETDTALAATARKTYTVGQALETDSALPATALQVDFPPPTRILVKTEAARRRSSETRRLHSGSTLIIRTPVSPPQIISVGQALETDSALAATWTKAFTVGQALETDSALAASFPTVAPPRGRRVLSIRQAVRRAEEWRQRGRGFLLVLDFKKQAPLVVQVGQALEDDQALPASPLVAGNPVRARFVQSTRQAWRRKEERRRRHDGSVFITRTPVGVGEIVFTVGLALETDTALPLVITGGPVLSVIANQYDRDVVSMSGNVKMLFGAYTFSASYATGGETFQLPPAAQSVISLIIAPKGGYVFVYEGGNLKAYRSSGAAGPLQEVPAGTNLAAVGALDFLAVTH